MRRILLILLVMTLLFLASCSSPEAQPPAAEPPTAEPPAADAPGTDASNQEPEIVYVDPEKAVAIYVNDKKIAQSGVYNDDYLTHIIEVPLISVFRELGASVTHILPTKIVVSYQEKEVTIDAMNSTIYLGNEEIICPRISGLPEAPIVCVRGTEIFVDQMRLNYVFENVLDLSLRSDYGEKELYIKEGSTWNS